MSVHYKDDMVTLHHGNALDAAASLEAGSVQTIVTSPPFWGLRDYDDPEQYGSEGSMSEYVDHLVALFAALRPALASDGTVWLNLGDSYNNTSSNQNGTGATTITGGAHDRGGPRRSRLPAPHLPPKSLLGMPWRVAFGLQDDGWVLRSDVVWAKPNPMPEPVTDRPTRAHEYLFLLAKQPIYYYDKDAIAEPDSGKPSGNGYGRPERVSLGGRGQDEAWTPGAGRNKRDVWTVAPQPFSEAHFAVYPPELIRPCILAGSRPGDLVLDPFSGSGTTGMVANEEGRRYVGFDLNADYLDMSLRTRFAQPSLGVLVGTTSHSIERES